MQRTQLQIQKESNVRVYTYDDLVRDSEGITNPLDANYELRIKRVQSVFSKDVKKAIFEEDEIKRKELEWNRKIKRTK
jgi:hypothetical protein